MTIPLHAIWLAQDDPKKKLVPGSIAARIAELNLSDKEKLEIAEKSKKALSGQEEIVMSEIDKQKNAKILQISVTI